MNLWFPVGVAGWFIVGMIWHDRALVMLNITSSYSSGLIAYYYADWLTKDILFVMIRTCINNSINIFTL